MWAHRVNRVVNRVVIRPVNRAVVANVVNEVNKVMWAHRVNRVVNRVVFIIRPVNRAVVYPVNRAVVYQHWRERSKREQWVNAVHDDVGVQRSTYCSLHSYDASSLTALFTSLRAVKYAYAYHRVSEWWSNNQIENHQHTWSAYRLHLFTLCSAHTSRTQQTACLLCLACALPVPCCVHSSFIVDSFVRSLLLHLISDFYVWFPVLCFLFSVFCFLTEATTHPPLRWLTDWVGIDSSSKIIHSVLYHTIPYHTPYIPYPDHTTQVWYPRWSWARVDYGCMYVDGRYLSVRVRGDWRLS